MKQLVMCSQVLIHLMDIEHNKCKFSNGFVELNPTTLEYYDTKLDKIFNHSNIKEIEIGEHHPLLLRVKEMMSDEDKYFEYSRLITKEWFSICRLIQDMPNANLLFINSRVDNEDYMVILKLNYTYAPTMVNETDGSGKEIIRISLKQTVPLKSHGIDEAIIININTNQLYIIEKRFMIDGKMNYYLNEQYLKGHPKLSNKDKLRIMNKAINYIDKQYQVNEIETPILIKHAILNCLLNQTEIKPLEIAKQIFEKDYGAQEECFDLMKDLGISEEDVVVVNEDIESYSKCKIKTDTDIQVTMNIFDYLNESFIKKERKEDGTFNFVFSNINEVIIK